MNVCVENGYHCKLKCERRWADLPDGKRADLPDGKGGRPAGRHYPLAAKCQAVQSNL